jgi:hypothetical protein
MFPPVVTLKLAQPGLLMKSHRNPRSTPSDAPPFQKQYVVIRDTPLRGSTSASRTTKLILPCKPLTLFLVHMLGTSYLGCISMATRTTIGGNKIQGRSRSIRVDGRVGPPEGVQQPVGHEKGEKQNKPQNETEKTIPNRADLHYAA